MSRRLSATVPLLGIAALGFVGCSDPAATPAPSFEELGGQEAAVCGVDVDNPDFTVDFEVVMDGCPTSIPGPSTEWEYEYRPAVSDAMSVFATYLPYYDELGAVSAERVGVSNRYAFASPPPLVYSNQFTVAYPQGVTGIKFRSFATLIDCSNYANAEACWLAAEDLGYSIGYHDEVRYCIVQTPAVTWICFATLTASTCTRRRSRAEPTSRLPRSLMRHHTWMGRTVTAASAIRAGCGRWTHRRRAIRRVVR